MPPPTLREVLEAAKVGETSDWEFKSAKGGLPRSLWETYSTMANTEGGVILLGATERDEGIRLDGLTDAELAKVLKELWDNLNNRGKVSANLLTNNEVAPLPTGSAQLLAIRVPRATRTQRPVYLRHRLGTPSAASTKEITGAPTTSFAECSRTPTQCRPTKVSWRASASRISIRPRSRNTGNAFPPASRATRGWRWRRGTCWRSWAAGVVTASASAGTRPCNRCSR